MRQQIFFVKTALALAGILFLTACGLVPGDRRPLAPSKAAYPDTRFLVVSDLHYFDTRLGTKGDAFQAYMDRDRKLLDLSGEILDTAVEKMAAEPADFVLVSGDLTKDGETVCHRGAAQRLRPLLASGKKVLVVPGNHDIANPESVRYQGDGTLPEPSVTLADFKEIYRDFGYGDALFQDPDSLSYVAEPVEGLWVLALDANRYRDNTPNHAVVGGALSEQTLAWTKERLADARQRGKSVIALLHHGVIPHYPANERFYSEYLVDDHETLARLLARYGVRLAFTGHFHAQDITHADVPLETGQAHRLFDVETGSLVTYPCPYRQVEISAGKARITSQFITSIPSMGKDFRAHARESVFTGTVGLANAKLTKFRVSESEQGKINHQIASAYLTHLKGDEVKPEKAIDPEGFGIWLRFIAWYQKDLLEGWVTDLPPADNALTVDLATGQVD